MAPPMSDVRHDSRSQKRWATTTAATPPMENPPATIASTNATNHTNATPCARRARRAGDASGSVAGGMRHCARSSHAVSTSAGMPTMSGRSRAAAG